MIQLSYQKLSQNLKPPSLMLIVQSKSKPWKTDRLRSSNSMLKLSASRMSLRQLLRRKLSLNKKSRVGAKKFTRWTKKWSSLNMKNRLRQPNKWHNCRQIRCKSWPLSLRKAKIITFAGSLTCKSCAKVSTGSKTISTCLSFQRSYKKSHKRLISRWRNCNQKLMKKLPTILQ